MERLGVTAVLGGYSAGMTWPQKICSEQDAIRIMQYLARARQFGVPAGIEQACGATVITLGIYNAPPEDVVFGKADAERACKVYAAFWEIHAREFAFIEMNGQSDNLLFAPKEFFDYLQAVLTA